MFMKNVKVTSFIRKVYKTCLINNKRAVKDIKRKTLNWFIEHFLIAQFRNS